MIDFLALRFVIVVVEQGSFRRAAATLSTRTSVISRRIRALEEHIGVSIFQRRSQGVQLTIAGRRIIAHCKAVMSAVETLLRTAALSGDGSEGHLRIGIVASIAGGEARELLATFIAAHKGVSLDLVEGLSQEHVAAVQALTMDVAIILDAPSPHCCNMELLWSEPVFVAISANSTLAAFSKL